MTETPPPNPENAEKPTNSSTSIFADETPTVSNEDEMDAPEKLDAAEQSLADALKTAFVILKLAMIVVLVAYVIIGGWFTVQQDERAVVLAFGKIVGTEGNQVKGPGGHFTLPQPLNERIVVNTQPRAITLRNQFFFEIADNQQAQSFDQMSGGAGPLNPELDGSLITGDANVVHGRFEMTYSVRSEDFAVVNFVRNVHRPSSTLDGNFELADQIVRNALERAVVHALSRTPADSFIRNQGRQNEGFKGVIVRETQRVLDELETGLQVGTLTATDTIVPLAVRASFRAVNEAESAKATAIDNARREYTEILTNSAGEASNDLYQLIKDFEIASESGNKTEEEKLQAYLIETFQTLSLPVAYSAKPVGGDVAEMINQANTYRTQVVEGVKGEANQFEALLQQYRANPVIMLVQRWEEARQAVFGNEMVETIYTPTGDIRIETNRDPGVRREREQRRLEEEQAARDEQSRQR